MRPPLPPPSLHNRLPATYAPDWPQLALAGYARLALGALSAHSSPLLVRHETDSEIEKRYTSGLTVPQREHCSEHYPDAASRKEFLIDLCIWVATAACEYLEQGQARGV